MKTFYDYTRKRYAYYFASVAHTRIACKIAKRKPGEPTNPMIDDERMDLYNLAYKIIDTFTGEVCKHSKIT